MSNKRYQSLPLIKILIASFGILLVLLTCPQVADAQTSPNVTAPLGNDSRSTPSLDIIIVNGDQLMITIFDTPELSGATRVHNDGTIDVPLIGSVHVSGLTVASAAASIRDRFIQGNFLKNPQVNVAFVDLTNHNAVVLGEVNRPGPVILNGTHTVWEVIGAAGGVTAAAGNRVTINHQGNTSAPTIIDLDWTKDLSGQANPQVNPGDTLQISRSGIVYVLGEVNQPGGYPIDHQKLTIAEAIALAKGVKYTSKASKSRLVRTGDRGKSITEIDVQKIVKGEKSDELLEANDVIYVPNSASKVAILRGLEAAVSITSAVIIYQNR